MGPRFTCRPCWHLPHGTLLLLLLLHCTLLLLLLLQCILLLLLLLLQLLLLLLQLLLLLLLLLRPWHLLLALRRLWHWAAADNVVLLRGISRSAGTLEPVRKLPVSCAHCRQVAHGASGRADNAGY